MSAHRPKHPLVPRAGPLTPRSAANRTRPNERQDAREDVAELVPAPRIDKPPSSLHRVPERFRRPNQILCSCCFSINYGAHLRDDLTARAGWADWQASPGPWSSAMPLLLYASSSAVEAIAQITGWRVMAVVVPGYGATSNQNTSTSKSPVDGSGSP